MKISTQLVIVLCMFAIVLSLWTLQSKEHDHKTYRYTYNGVEYHKFTICGDTSLVAKGSGNHWDYIPKRFKPFMNPKFRVEK